MKKLLSVVLAATILIAPLTTHAATYQPIAQQRGFNYTWISQSPNPTLRPGDTAILWVKIKNTGSVAWNNQIRLGTSREQDRASQFVNTDSRSRWIGTNRIKLENDNNTEVGATTGFGFYITVPQDMPSGIYREYFQPVYDGVGWMKDIGIYWDITVSGDAYVEKSITGTVGETVSFTYDFLSGDRTPSTAAAEFSYDTESLDLIEHIYDPASSNPPNTIINNGGTAPSGAIVQWKEKFSFRIKKPGSHIVELYRLGAQHKNNPEYANYTSRIEIRGISQQTACTQVVTSAENPATGEVKQFPTPCDVPAGWEERFGQFGTPRPAATWSTFVRDYDYELVDQSFAKSSYQEGDEDILVVRLKNTGRAPWYNYGPHAVYLGTSHPQDALSKAVSLGYLGDTNRVAFVPDSAPNQFMLENDGSVSGVVGNVLSDVVNPGQIARFEIPIAAPEVASDFTYREYFQPVVEGIGWMKDIGLYWNITVTNGSTVAPPEETSDQLTEDDIDISFFRFITIQSDKTHVTPGGSATISWGINPFFASLLEPAELQTLRSYLVSNVSCSVDGSAGGTAFEGSFVVSNITSDHIYNMSCYDRKKNISYQTNPDTESSAVVVVVSSLPAKPYAVTATPQSNGDILIRWQNSNTITPYSSAFTITYSTNPTFTTSGEGLVGFNILPGDQTEYTISRDRLEPNTTYYVVVRFNGPVDGYEYVPSPNSDMVSFRTGNF